MNETTLKAYLAEYQLKVLQNHGDCLNEIIASMIDYVRAEIASNPKNRLDQDPTALPESVIAATCHLIIEALQSRIPALKLSADQIRNANNARRFLARIAKGEVSPFCQQGQLMGVVHQARPRQATFENLKGL